jgi:hypothetical protein
MPELDVVLLEPPPQPAAPATTAQNSSQIKSVRI